jgi:hypothetical protein
MIRNKIIRQEQHESAQGIGKETLVSIYCEEKTCSEFHSDHEILYANQEEKCAFKVRMTFQKSVRVITYVRRKNAKRFPFAVFPGERR